MKLLDLFCGAGGCAVGYHRAGFTEITGVDIRPQPRYPFTFVQGDAMEYLAAHGHEFDAIHASPPCQAFSATRHLPNVRTDRHVDLIGPSRAMLSSIARPYVIENVEGSPVGAAAGRWAISLCGLMFGLRVFRHRLFESNVLLLGQPHRPHGDRRIGVGGFVCVAGNGGGSSIRWKSHRRAVPNDHRNKAAWSAAMGIDWMTRDELAQAIPPAYTQYIGRQLIAAVRSLPSAAGNNAAANGRG